MSSGTPDNQPAQQPVTRFSECTRCGALVGNRDRHKEWHRWVENGEGTGPGEMAKAYSDWPKPKDAS